MSLGALFYPGDVPFDDLYIPYIYKEIYLEGIYTDVFNEQPYNSMTIIDIGANIGIVTQFMRQYAKKLYAVEPATEHFEALKKNKEFNHWDNVELFNFAISDTDGDDMLRIYKTNRTSHSIVKFLDNDKFISEKVKTKAFDTFFKENKIDEVDFIKFDVEGAEEKILFSPGFVAVADKIKAIEIEFHFATYPKIVEHLLNLGFKSKRYASSAVVILFYK